MLEGIIYAPGARVKLNGNGGTLIVDQVIANTFDINGNGGTIKVLRGKGRRRRDHGRRPGGLTPTGHRSSRLPHATLRRVIVVIGGLGLRGSVEEPEPDGLAPAIAVAAAAAGARVELDLQGRRRPGR